MRLRPMGAMNYVCLVYRDEAADASISDDDLRNIVSAVGSFIGELEENGQHVFSSGLQAASTATTLKPRDGGVVVTDGPFAETKECLGGFTIVSARDLNEAIQLGSRLAAACQGTVEVRPVMSPDVETTDPIDKRIVTLLREAASAGA